MITTVTETNYIIYAAKHYDSLFPDTLEFNEDLKRVVYLKRLFNVYKETGEVKDRLILNHLIVLFNMFGEHATPMLFLKLKGHERTLKTFLTFLGRMPETINKIGLAGTVIVNKDIPLDTDLLDKLNKL